jgi:leucyl aminopeptidase
MPITFTVTSQLPERVSADLLAVPVYADRKLGSGAEALDDGLGPFMQEAGFDGKSGQTLALPATSGLSAKAVLLVGLGQRGELTVDSFRQAGAAVARKATKAKTLATTLLDAAPDGLDAAKVASAFAEGVVLGSYRYLQYKSEGDPSELQRVIGVGADNDIKVAFEHGRVIASAVWWARDMVNEPSGDKSPEQFAAAARKLLTGKGVTVTVLSEPQLRAEKMGGVLGVAQGSARPPRFMKVVYAPPGSRSSGTLALVGKGVVFDSGGLSIKTSGGMETMKTDMGGAAAVLAAMSVLRDVGVKRRVVAYAPMVENMPSGTAIRPGDVLRIRNGKTVEVLNTDAEGRLILADALSLAVDDGADAIVDLATLTGACVVALGEKVAGLMGNHDEWRGQVGDAAGRAAEAVWALPLPDDYNKMLDSEVADLRNIGTSSYGGALTAGLFLEAFVSEVPWAHLDIAGPARAGSDDGYIMKGGTGFGVRTLVELAQEFDAPARPSKNGAVRKAGAKRAKKAAATKTTKGTAGTKKSTKKSTKRARAK